MIDFQQSREYTLSIRLCTDGFCFTVHHPKRSEQFCFTPYTVDTSLTTLVNLKKAVTETELLQHPYGKVNILLVNTRYTVVPKEFYNPDEARELYRQNFPQTGDSEQVLTDELPDGSAVVLFAIDKNLQQYLQTAFPPNHIHCLALPLVHYALQKSKEVKERFFLTVLHEKKLEILVADSGRLLFANTFANEEAADSTYFLLNLWKVLQLSQEEDCLYIAGSSRNKKALLENLKPFIRHLQVLRPADEFPGHELLRVEELPFDHQLSIVCEL